MKKKYNQTTRQSDYFDNNFFTINLNNSGYKTFN